MVRRIRTMDVLGDLIKGITGYPIQSFHADISTRTGERFIVITLAEDLEALTRKGQE
ncbi:MAG: DUF2294 family protein [Deltaproteobacteria bacterium]|nr:DUF2294 family protein [Deltaproteobacteria bacterium]